jgi:cellobiose-specific phosphotransferase system component IIA
MLEGETEVDTSNPLGPIFAAGVAVQQLLEALSPLVEKFFGEARKKMVLGVVGFIVGLILASYFKLYVLTFFKVANSGGVLDIVVTALILSAGTEGTNSIVKFLKYLKEDKKTEAAEKVQRLTGRSDNAASPEALKMRDRLRAEAGGESVRDRTSIPTGGSRTSPESVKAFSYISGK